MRQDIIKQEIQRFQSVRDELLADAADQDVRARSMFAGTERSRSINRNKARLSREQAHVYQEMIMALHALR